MEAELKIAGNFQQKSLEISSASSAGKLALEKTLPVRGFSSSSSSGAGNQGRRPLNPGRPSPSRVASAVSRAAVATSVTADEIRHGGTANRISRARWLVWRELYEAGFGMAGIAYVWGCDHTTILHAKRKNWGAS